MMNPDDTACSFGQRVVTAFAQVLKPVHVQIADSNCFGPPNVKNAIGTGIGTLMPTIPTSISSSKCRASRRRS